MGEDLRVIADAPSKTDLLGLKPSVNALHSIVTSESTITPFTIGIFGDWGAGKSTLLLQLRSRLANDGFPTVVFNPWKYDGKEDVSRALIQTILLTFFEEESDETGKERIKSVLTGVAKMAADHFLEKIAGDKVDYDSLVQEYTRISAEKLQFINQFESAFTELVEKYTGDKRLIILIDDLDRCTPESAIATLEAIKLFLSVPNCIFVIAVENNIVQEGIKHKYGTSVSFSGRDYLEKIIQLPFSIPKPNDDAMRQFLDFLSRGALSDVTSKIAVCGSDSNPRRLKRFANSYALSRFIVENSPDEDINESILSFILMIQIRFPDHYIYYSMHPSDLLDLIEKIGSAEFYTRQELDNLSGMKSEAHALLVEPSFRSFVNKLVEQKFAEFEIGDEGLTPYLQATQASSVTADNVSESYFTPEIAKLGPEYGSIYQPLRPQGPPATSSVRLINAGASKINVIKEVRGITGLGLKEAKDLVEAEGSMVVRDIATAEAETIAVALRRAGAAVELV